MTATSYPTLRDLVLECAARNGWHTQRRIAVSCAMEESALSRFLDGRQDLGAVATFELFRAVSVPVEQYPLAFELLRRAQEEARRLRETRDGQARPAAAALESAAPPPQPAAAPAPPAATAPSMLYRSVAQPKVRAPRDVAALAHAHGLTPGTDAPSLLVAELFATESFTGQEIAAFFAGLPKNG